MLLRRRHVTGEPNSCSPSHTWLTNFPVSTKIIENL